MQNSPLFDGQRYKIHRPLYPVATFTELFETFERENIRAPYQIADLGCGTGFSSFSFLETGANANIVGIEPDEGMLREAVESARSRGDEATQFRFAAGTAEDTGLPASSVDSVLIGSAFHWMHPEKTRQEILRILRARGAVLIFEYQFPKSVSHPELDEWIRRQFNQAWKAPNQVPRGSLKELTDGFRKDSNFREVNALRPVPMQHRLNAAALTGLLLSQSRVLHYESTLDQKQRARFPAELCGEIEARLSPQGDDFDFKLTRYLFIRASSRERERTA